MLQFISFSSAIHRLYLPLHTIKSLLFKYCLSIFLFSVILTFLSPLLYSTPSSQSVPSPSDRMSSSLSQVARLFSPVLLTLLTSAPVVRSHFASPRLLEFPLAAFRRSPSPFHSSPRPGDSPFDEVLL